MIVIPFTTPAERPRRADIPDSEPRGAILFFTGVRIERHEGSQAAPEMKILPAKAKARASRPSRKA